ncbi:Bax inhibitor-1 family protein [Candidatus Peregrinibacteria bacterium]|nr:Bax inhibitor-1 family protein [Candidatus Peregrinibacteria bacterium]
MTTFASSRSQAITLSPSTEAQVYGLLTLAMLLTLFGVFFGTMAAQTLLFTGAHIIFLIAELAIIFTSGFWANKSPLNYILFGLFPVLSGFTITPYLLYYVLSNFENGSVILFDAALTTVFMTAAAAVFARTTSINLAGMRGVLFMGLIGLLVVGILQIFLPALQQLELVIAGAGVLLFAAFITFDIQRTQVQARAGGNPFLLALSLYLDIFNLFLYVVRFMVAMSGNRR